MVAKIISMKAFIPLKTGKASESLGFEDERHWALNGIGAASWLGQKNYQV